MANTRDIRRRIKSVKNTAQITKAMQMVAATKMRRAQARAIAGRPYADLLDNVATRISGELTDSQHPLVAHRPVAKRCILLVSTDRGLCGGLNTNLFREIQKADTADTVYVTIGRKARQFVPRLKVSGEGSHGKNLLADFELKDNFTFADSKRISQFLLDQFAAGVIDEVFCAYTHFVNALNQEAKIETLFPMGGRTNSRVKKADPATAAEVKPVYLFEPEADTLLHTFLPFVVHFEVYHHILDARASEWSARMVAMKNATENAKDLIQDLTLEYNKVRQASITTELLEITTAQMALA